MVSANALQPSLKDLPGPLGNLGILSGNLSPGPPPAGLPCPEALPGSGGQGGPGRKFRSASCLSLLPGPQLLPCPLHPALVPASEHTDFPGPRSFRMSYALRQGALFLVVSLAHLSRHEMNGLPAPPKGAPGPSVPWACSRASGLSYLLPPTALRQCPDSHAHFTDEETKAGGAEASLGLSALPLQRQGPCHRGS